MQPEWNARCLSTSSSHQLHVKSKCGSFVNETMTCVVIQPVLLHPSRTANPTDPEARTDLQNVKCNLSAVFS